MKKLIAILLCATLGLSAVACSKKPVVPNENEPQNTETTEVPTETIEDDPNGDLASEEPIEDDIIGAPDEATEAPMEDPANDPIENPAEDLPVATKAPQTTPAPATPKPVTPPVTEAPVAPATEEPVAPPTEEPTSTVDKNSPLADIIAQIYVNANVESPMLMNTPVTADNAAYMIGTTNVAFAEGLASEAAIMSIPHSLVVLRMKPGSNIAAAKTQIKDNIDPRKWVCAGVNPDQVIVDSVGDIIFVVMSVEAAAYHAGFLALGL